MFLESVPGLLHLALKLPHSGSWQIQDLKKLHKDACSAPWEGSAVWGASQFTQRLWISVVRKRHSWMVFVDLPVSSNFTEQNVVLCNLLRIGFKNNYLSNLLFLILPEILKKKKVRKTWKMNSYNWVADRRNPFFPPCFVIKKPHSKTNQSPGTPVWKSIKMLFWWKEEAGEWLCIALLATNRTMEKKGNPTENMKPLLAVKYNQQKFVAESNWTSQLCCILWRRKGHRAGWQSSEIAV